MSRSATRSRAMIRKSWPWTRTAKQRRRASKDACAMRSCRSGSSPGEFVSEDGCIRPATSLEALASLKPAFAADGVVTAGTSSPSDRWRLRSAGQQRGICRSARSASSGTHPRGGHHRLRPAVMGIGPIPATRKAMARAGLDVSSLDVVEINEAFASQSLACIRELTLEARHHQPGWRRHGARPSVGRNGCSHHG